VSYANDFPPSWLDYELIIGSSLGVPTRKGAIEEIGFATPLGKGKEKKGKKSAKGKPKTRKALRILRLAKVLRKGRLL